MDSQIITRICLIFGAAKFVGKFQQFHVSYLIGTYVHCAYLRAMCFSNIFCLCSFVCCHNCILTAGDLAQKRRSYQPIGSKDTSVKIEFRLKRSKCPICSALGFNKTRNYAIEEVLSLIQPLFENILVTCAFCNVKKSLKASKFNFAISRPKKL